jgi:adenylylsulfate kinase-like enzyme
VQHFTGISDPYETPTDPDLAIDTTGVSVDEAAERILGYLESEGYLSGSGSFC